VFLFSPRERTLGKPNTGLMTPITCSTLARTFGLGAVFRPLGLIDNTAVAIAAIGEIAGLGRMLSDHRPLAAVGLITPQAGLLPVQQLGQHRAVGDIGRCGHHGVDQLGAAVDPEMRLHPEIPLVALLGLVLSADFPSRCECHAQGRRDSGLFSQ